MAPVPPSPAHSKDSMELAIAAMILAFFMPPVGLVFAIVVAATARTTKARWLGIAAIPISATLGTFMGVVLVGLWNCH